jgi:hypothetical protein
MSESPNSYVAENPSNKRLRFPTNKKGSPHSIQWTTSNQAFNPYILITFDDRGKINMIQSPRPQSLTTLLAPPALVDEETENPRFFRNHAPILDPFPELAAE